MADTVRNVGRTRPKAALWQTGLIAFAAAAIANLALYGLANALLAEPLRVPPEVGVVNVLSVVISTLAGTVGALVTFTLVKRFARRPAGTFQLLALIALIVSMAGPLGAPGIALATRLVLALMHIVTAAIIVALFIPRTREP